MIIYLFNDHLASPLTCLTLNSVEKHISEDCLAINSQSKSVSPFEFYDWETE